MARYRINPNAARERFNLSLDPLIHEQARDLAHADGVSLSEVVNTLLANAIKRDLAAREAAKKKVKKKSALLP